MMNKQINNSYCCVGLMSGTSLDGLDLVLCQLEQRDEVWNYKINKCTTIVYSSEWRRDLQNAPNLTALGLISLHRKFGLWIAKQVLAFIDKEDVEIDFIASHGHTVFHEPDKQVNFQLGDGATVAAHTGITTVSDFRSLDICLKGQGAPLVPIGDKLLFGEYDACANIGGFANVSFTNNDQVMAWDICPVNFVINRLVNTIGLEMDKDGEMGAKGACIESLLEQLNSLEYYKKDAPKSLSQEWVDTVFFPLLKPYEKYELNDVIRTCYEHFSDVIAKDINAVVQQGRCLFTGGGVYNNYLIKRVSDKLNSELIVPSSSLIDFKEALVFALLGALRVSEQTNCLSSVTGSVVDNCSGIINLGRKKTGGA